MIYALGVRLLLLQEQQLMVYHTRIHRPDHRSPLSLHTFDADVTIADRSVLRVHFHSLLSAAMTGTRDSPPDTVRDHEVLHCDTSTLMRLCLRVNTICKIRSIWPDI